MIAYNIKVKVHNIYIFVRETKVMYGIPQAGNIAHDALVKYLETYGYHHTNNTPGIWKHDIWPINFTLVIDNFGVRYYGKEHSHHLKKVLDTK